MTSSPGLLDLHTQDLSPEDQVRLSLASSAMLGPASWQARKRSDLRELLALAARSPRLHVSGMDGRTELRVGLELVVPVPCRPQADGPIVVAQRALLGVRYPAEALLTPRPGTDFVTVLAPRAVFAPNIAAGLDQRLCLGASLPAGIPLREIVLASYAALSMQTVTMDPEDPQGLLNHEAALYWQQHAADLPLTRASLLSDPEGLDAGWGAASSQGHRDPAGDAGRESQS
jgi:hypothetical protein